MTWKLTGQYKAGMTAEDLPRKNFDARKVFIKLSDFGRSTKHFKTHLKWFLIAFILFMDKYLFAYLYIIHIIINNTYNI